MPRPTFWNRLPFPLIRRQVPTNYYDRPDPSYVAPWARDPVDFPSRSRHPLISRITDWLFILILLVGTQLFFTVVKPPVTYFRIDDPSLMLPEVPEIIPSSLTPVFTIGIPIVVMIFFECLFFFDPWNMYHLCTGYAETTALSLFITSILWIFLGSLRPTFLTKCQPDLSKVVPGKVWYTVAEICTQHLNKDEFHAFPSGHASTAWSGFVFFSLYMSTKVKAWSPAAQFWKVVFFIVVPIAAALWITTTRVIDHHHTALQVTVGSIIGTLGAFAGYTRNFTGLFTWRNHVPARYAYHKPESVSSLELAASQSDDVLVGRHELGRSVGEEQRRQVAADGARVAPGAEMSGVRSNHPHEVANGVV
ncbi:hypothetical protein HK097_006460 [Rhizophlyctis rosea]|uniref:Phosphatidic acid phosphatase type 2/haloperoxidase domain-containing protein n=1 Tax=Rhizophlyctis rosea TaxID=64517 RepID=A0AAD5X248_9FUNG|nr:hypothetical protein HK097_006460 [Rhizophlyctis rosea]